MTQERRVINRALLVMDATGVVTYWDARAELAFGYEANEVLGRPGGELLMSARVAREERAQVRGILQSGGRWTGRMLARHRLGHDVEVDLDVQGLVRFDGSSCGVVLVATPVEQPAASEDGAFGGSRAVVHLVVLVRVTGEIVFLGPNFRAVFGYDERTGGPPRFRDLVHPEDLPLFRAVAHAAADGDSPVAGVRVRLRTADGRWRWVEGGARSRLVDPAGAILVVSGKDVTEQVEIEQQARELAAIVEASPDAIFRTELDGTVTYWSPGAETLFGRRSSQTVGCSIFDVMFPPGTEHRGRAAMAAAARGEVFTADHEVGQDATGGRLELSVTVVPLRDPGGGVVAAAALLRDISAQVRYRRALEHSEARYRAIVHAAHEGILVLDPDFTVLLGNARAEAAFGPITGRGRSVGEVLGGDHPDDVARRLRGSALGRDEVFELDAVDQRGARLTMLISAAPLTDESGEQVGSVVMLVDVTEANQAREELTRLALSDPLTGLANRALLTDRLAHACARRHHHRVAVLFLDLDNFKTVNDSLGHEAGDVLLRAVAARISQAVRPADTVGRLGGDEFVIIGEDVGSDADAVIFAERILTAVVAPLVISGVALTPTASIGIAMADDAADPGTLLRDADTAMYRAKDAGGGRAWLFRPELHEDAVARLTTLTELPGAAARGELVVHYQPMIDLTDGKPCGTEALVRWDHPRDGLLAPHRFMHLAESSGAILDIGDWVMVEAMRQSARWAHERPDLARVSINLSVRQLCDDRLFDRVAAALDRTAADPGLITLEITESALMADADGALATLQALRRLGVSLSIDDFGTGYSSLIYLREFPVNEIKIDRVFVAGVTERAQDRTIISALIALAHGFGAQTCGEGVETVGQWEALRELGCDRAQGYLMARPAPAAEVGDRL